MSGSGVERGDDEFLPVVDVLQPHAEHSLVGGFEHHVVQRLLQPDRADVSQPERVAPVVEREPEPVPLGRVGERESADLTGQGSHIALLQAQQIRLVLVDELFELFGGAMLAQVVRDDLHHRYATALSWVRGLETTSTS